MAVMNGQFRLAADEARKIESLVRDAQFISERELCDKYDLVPEELSGFMFILDRLKITIPDPHVPKKL